MADSTRVMFAYWGRRGLTRFALEVACAASRMPGTEATFSISRQNENFAAFEELGQSLFTIDTFRSSHGALTLAWRIAVIRHRLFRYLTDHRIQAVIELMPHVWSPLIAPVIKAAGVRYVTIAHDGVTHSGDYRSAIADKTVTRALAQADLVLTLSETVAGRLRSMGKVPRAKIYTLFHPDLDFGGAQPHQLPQLGEPLRLAFMGRILPYKGLPLFIEMIELLREEGIPVEAGVFGEGALGESAIRLEALGAEVVNRWLTDAEIAAILSRYHALVLSHIGASQSGIAASAFGAGLPVVANPVGGLSEQVQDGVNGILAQRADAPSLAEAVTRRLLDPQLYRAICQNLTQTKGERSMARFVEDCVSHALYAGPTPSRAKPAAPIPRSSKWSL